MHIEKLRTISFRNMEDGEIVTQAKNIYLTGKNGQGKTNFLEALYFCAYASSFRGIKDIGVIKNGEHGFSTQAYLSGSEYNEVFIKYSNGKKQITLDGKSVDRKYILSVMPSIIFCHEDMEFITGSPERRRWFFDQNLSLIDSFYLEYLRAFRKVLKSRNCVLKDLQKGKSIDLLETLDVQLVDYGIKLMEKRAAEAKLVCAILEPLYSAITGLDGVCLEYAPSWKTYDKQIILEMLLRHREREILFGLTLNGPHRDKYVFLRKNNVFDVNASMGERRILALLLRSSQAIRYREVVGSNPILLLDDVLLELDGEKRIKFIELMPEYDQAFFTFLPEEHYEHYNKNNTIVYCVNNGKYTQIGEK
jgi:DNA replication and repair protein RecF